jgi:hypothetical protein
MRTIQLINKTNKIYPEINDIFAGNCRNVITILVIIITIVTMCNDRSVCSPGIWQDRRHSRYQLFNDTLRVTVVYCRWREVYSNSHTIETQVTV